MQHLGEIALSPHAQADRGPRRLQGASSSSDGEDEAPPPPRGSKRARTEEEAADEDATDEEDAAAGDSADEGGSGPGPGSGSGSEDGSASGSEASGAAVDAFLMSPLTIEDPRRPDQVLPPSDIPLHDYDALFQWLVSPVDADTFLGAVFQRQPAVVARPHNRQYYAGLLTKGDVDAMLRSAPGLQYAYNVDVVKYEGGARVNYNFNGKKAPSGGGGGGDAARVVADADVVWRRFAKDGCSVRLLHPQRSSDPLWRLLARLEGFWQSCLGCNAYLTPPGAQGFSPHWDDIDAFVLQVEGAKRWRLYAPTDPRHVLPRHSSRDFARAELGECVLDVVLRPGDLLYMPRGTVHEAQSLPDAHSLHLTLSANQQRTWATFLEEALPRAVKGAAGAALRLRRCLPRGFADYMGAAAHDERSDEDEDEEEDGDERSEGEAARRARRAAFAAQARACVDAVVGCLDLDWAADQFASDFMLHRLPPALPVADAGAASGSGPPRVGPRASVRLALPGLARLSVDADAAEPVALVSHCLSNAREQHAAGGDAEGAGGGGGEEGVPPELEFPLACADTLAAVLRSGGAAVAVADLPDPDLECGVSAVEVAQALLTAGIVVLAK